MLGGVCAGIASAYHFDVTVVRVVFVLLAFFTSGLWLLFYFAAWLVMPGPEQSSLGATEVARANVGDMVNTAKQRASELRGASADDLQGNVRRAAQDLTRAASSAAQSARDALSRGSGSGGSSAAPRWTPPSANPRARHGGFKPKRNTPPSERV
jgi:phage shock protein PspC (stress-responsive transcriptional regulator)